MNSSDNLQKTMNLAQQAYDAAASANGSASRSAEMATKQGWTPELVQFLSIAILVFTFLTLFLSTILMWRNKAPGEHILKVFGVVSIIGISALLVVAGYDHVQLTPIVGLFGAVAGYLLGKEVASSNTHKPSEPPDK
jgi:hypothetical protein